LAKKSSKWKEVFAEMKVLVIGESCNDVFHYGESIRLCPEAPVPVFKSIEVFENGGMAMNVVKNLNSMGVSANIVTNQNFHDIKKTRFVDFRTNHMFLRVDESDDSYGTLDMKAIKEINFSDYDGVAVSDYDKGFLTEEVLCEISKSHPLTFLDTKKILGEWCKEYRFIKINSREYEITKSTLTEGIMEKLIVTRGPHGCEHKNNNYPVPSVEVKDTSGAGDTFLAALTKRYLETKNVESSIEFANNCSTKVVQKRGVSCV